MMKKTLAAISLALSASVMANDEVYVGSAYIDNHPSNSPGGIDVVRQVPGEHKIVVYYSDPNLGRCEINITGLPTNPFKPVNPLTKLQYLGGQVYMNLVTQNASTGHIIIPSNCPSSVAYVPNDNIYFWANVGVMPCENGTATCPVEVFKGRYRVRTSKNDSAGPIKPSPWQGDMGAGGAADVVYDDANDKYYINWTGVNGKGHVLLEQDAVDPPQTLGSHFEGFNVRAVDPETKVDLLLTNSAKNQLGFISKPVEGSQAMYFLPFYLREKEDGSLALASIGTGGCSWNCNAEPEDSVDVDQYGFSIDDWFASDDSLWDLFWGWVNWTFKGHDSITAPPAGCLIKVGYDGEPNPYYYQAYHGSYMSYGLAGTVGFEARWFADTPDQEVEVQGPTHFNPHPVQENLFQAVRTWKPLPFGAHKFWGHGPNGTVYHSCIFVPLPDQIGG